MARGVVKIKGRMYHAYSQGSKALCDEVARQLRKKGYTVSVRLVHRMKTHDQYVVYVKPDLRIGEI